MTLAEKLIEVGNNRPKLYNKGALDYSPQETVSGEAIGITDISPIEHNMGVSVRGKNLIPFPYYSTTKEVNGVTFTVNEDGTVTVNGTASSITQFNLYMGGDLLLPNVKYTLSGGDGNGSATTYDLRITDSKTTAYTCVTNKSVSFSYADTSKIVISIMVRSGAVLNNVVFKPMIEEGTTSTSYAPYIEDISTVKLYKQGKNLLPLSFNIELPYTTNGITFDYNGDGGIKVSGTATSSATIYYKNLLLFAGITYRLVHIGGVSGVNTFISYYDENGTAQLYATKSNANFTWKDTYKFRNCFLQVDSKKTVDVVIYPMLILSTADRTEYEPYIEPIVYDVKADGIVEGVTSLYPSTTLYTDTQGAVIDCTYYQDGKKVKENLIDMILELGGVINE